MPITFSIDNDRILSGDQELALDESFGVQTGADTDGVIDYDVAAEYSGPGGSLSSSSLDAVFIAYVNGLSFADAAARDTALGFVAANGAASSISDFITITPTAGETITNLFFSLDPQYANQDGSIDGVTALDGAALFFHIDPGNSDRALVTTSATAGEGRIVAAFYLDENPTDHLTAQVQMVTFEALHHPDATNPDDAVDFTDLLQISASGSLSFDFDELPSGSFLWAALGGSSAGLLVTGHDLNVDTRATIGTKVNGKYGEIITGGSTDPSDTVNTSQGGQGATIGINSQHFVRGAKVNGTYQDGSIATFTLVEGFSPLENQKAATGTNIQTIQYDDYINTIGAGIFISQLTGTHADMRISLFNADLDGNAQNGLQVEESFDYLGDPLTDAHLTDDLDVNVATVTISRAGFTPVVFSGSGGTSAALGVTVTISGNDITVTGAHALDTIKWDVGGTFNRFTVQALGSTDAFDIGRVDIAQGVTVSEGLGSHLLVDDSGPSVTGTLLVAVDEDNMTGAAGGDLSTGVVDGDQVTDEVLISDTALAGIVNPGTDKPALFGLDLDGSIEGTAVRGVDTFAVYSKGTQVLYHINGSVIEGVAGDRVVFTLTRVDDAGTNTHGWVFDLKDQIDHATASGDEGYRDLNLAPAFTVTDSDLDPGTLGNAIQVRVENDVPILSGSTASVRVEEDELPTGNTDGDPDTATATFTKAALAATVTDGADEPVVWALVSSFAANTAVRDVGGNAMTSKGEAMFWSVSGGVVSAVAGGRTVFTITASGTDFVVQLSDQIDHLTATGDGGVETLDVTPAFVATDYDGDIVDLNGANNDQHPIQLVVENDIPVLSGNTASVRVEEDELPTGNTDGDPDTATATFTKAALQATVTPGADEPVVWALVSSFAANTAVRDVGGNAMTSKGDAMIWSVSGGVVSAVAGGRTVFTITASGTDFVVDLEDQIDHAPASGDGGVKTLDVTPAFVATDYDGDTVDLNGANNDKHPIQLVVENDIPILSGTTASVRVEEDELTGGNTDSDSDTATATFTKAALQATVTPGADEPVVWALVSSFAANTAMRNTDGDAMTSKGVAMIWSVSGGVVSAMAGARTVFTITPSGNDFVVNLVDQIDHLSAMGDDGIETLDVTPAFVGTDYDGDTVDLNGANNDQSPIQLVVENDVPVITSQILNSILDVQTAVVSVTKSLNGAIGGDENTATNATAAGKQTYTFDTYTTPTNVWANLTPLISLDRTTINYYESALAGADLVYSIVLGQAGAGTYTFTVHKEAPDQKLEFNFTDLPSGQNLFGVLVNHPASGAPEADGPGLLVVGADAILNGNGGYTNASDTINTSKGGGGVTSGVDNQMFDVGDAAIFVFVDNPDDKSIGGVGLTQTTADDADTLGFTGLHGAGGGEIEVVQQQGSATLKMLITAYDLVVPDAAGDGAGIKSANDPLGATPPTTDDVSVDSRTFLDNPINGATAVSIKTVSVYDRANPSDVLESVTIDQSTGEVTNVDGDGDGVVDNSSIDITSQQVAPGKWSVVVSGFTANDTIAYTTEGDHEAVRVEGMGGKWDLGGFNLSEGVDTPDQAFDFSVLINDYDGDTSGGSGTTFANFHVGLDGTGAYDDSLVAGVPII